MKSHEELKREVLRRERTLFVLAGVAISLFLAGTYGVAWYFGIH